MHACSSCTFYDLPQSSYPYIQFESYLQEEDEPSEPVAKTMLVLMVRGLITKLEFPYAQFPCCDVTGDQMFDSFWEAVRHLEIVGLKVLAATLTVPLPIAGSSRSMLSEHSNLGSLTE